MLTAKRAEFLFFNALALARNDERFRHFPSDFICHADHRDFLHLGMLRKNILNFSRIDVLSGGDDEVFLTSGYGDEALFIEFAQIAGVQPLSRDRLCRLFRKPVVAGHHISAAHHDFTHLARRQHSVIFIPDHDFHAWQWLSNGAEFSVAGPIESHDWSSFCLPISFVDWDRES